MQTKIKFSKCVQLDVAKSQYVCHHIIVKGRLDFLIEKKTVSVTELRRNKSPIIQFVTIPGHIVFITRRGKPDCVMMSIETWACMSEDYGAVIESVEAACQEYREKRRANRRAKRNGTSNM